MFIAARSRRSKSTTFRGATLLELLVVILIVLSVTALSIPVVAPALQGRRLREGARMLSTFLNAARNRAVESGRPAGVWLERMPAYPEAVSNVYMAEVPPPYGGDFIDSSINGIVINKDGRCDGLALPNQNDQDFWNVIIPRTRTTFLTDSWASPDPQDQQIVREGDLIKIEGLQRLYTLRIIQTAIDGYGGANDTKKWWYILRGRNSSAGPEANWSGARDYENRFIIDWYDRLQNIDTGVLRNARRVFDTDVVGRRYQIFRQPNKIVAGGIQLPDGVVIDLNFSSMSDGTLNYVTFPSSVYGATTNTGVVITTTGNSWLNSGPYTDVGGSVPFHPRFDPDDKTFNPYWGDPVYPQDRTPVIIVFAPGGQVDRVYKQSRGQSRAHFIWEGVYPIGTISLLVGKLDKIFPDEQYRVSQSPKENLDFQLKKNWLDLENIWVTIDPVTGFITTSAVDDVADVRDDYTVAADPRNVVYARWSASRIRRNVGGR